MRKSNHPRAAHLQEELHVEIVAFAAPAEAYARMAYALTQVRRYLIPDNNDQVSVLCACRRLAMAKCQREGQSICAQQ